MGTTLTMPARKPETIQRYQKSNQKTTEKKLSKPEATVEKREESNSESSIRKSRGRL